MAYDLQEQESLDELKAWWEKWGNLVLSVITVVCLAFAGYNGMKWWERHQAQEASVAYSSLQTAIMQQAEASSVEKIVDAKKDFEVTVNFDRCGVRSMFASFSNLKKIEEHMNAVYELGTACGLSREELMEMFALLGEGE